MGVKKNVIQLTESQLNRAIKESVRKVIKETVESDYQQWKIEFDSYLQEALQYLSEFVKDLRLVIQIDQNYNFGRKPWLASYEYSQGLINQGIIKVAINYHRLFKMMKKKHIEHDAFNIEAQTYLNLAHEVGHGIYDYILNVLGDCCILDGYNEEELVEEFAKTWFEEGTGVSDCDFDNIIEQIKENIQNGKYDY